MYNNVGGKLKTAAVTMAVILSIACVSGGIALLSEYGRSFRFIAISLMLAGPMMIWLSSLVLYALGEAVEKLGQIEVNTRNNRNQFNQNQNNIKRTSHNAVNIGQNRIKKQAEYSKKQTDGSDEGYAIIQQMWKDKGWICPNCGKLITSGRSSCYDCGFELSGKYELFVDLEEQLSGTCDICGRQSEDIREVHAEDNDCETDCLVCRSCLSKVTNI